MLLWIAIGFAGAVMGLAVTMRVIPSDPERWHVDPLTAPTPATPNAYRVGADTPDGPPVDRVAPVYMLPAAELARVLDDLIMGEPRSERLARSENGLWTTYVVRSRVMGFPDYASVRVTGLDEGTSTLAIFSRSRFGSSDLGVNKARVINWLAGLADFER